MIKYDKTDLTINKILDTVNKIDTDWKICKLPAKDTKEYALRVAGMNEQEGGSVHHVLMGLILKIAANTEGEYQHNPDNKFFQKMLTVTPNESPFIKFNDMFEGNDDDSSLAHNVCEAIKDFAEASEKFEEIK